MILLSKGYEATKELRDSLSHVLWIGGASDSGKSTVTRMLAGKFTLAISMSIIISSLVPILRYIPRCTES